MTRAKVKYAVAPMLRTGIGMRISSLLSVSKVAVRQDVGEILGSLQAAGKDHPQQGQRYET